MPDFNWADVLHEWNDRLLASHWADELSDDVQRSKWLGFPPATDSQIADAEKRIGIPLPPSFREFLKVSNGWRRLNHSIDQVYGTGEIEWFKRDNSDWIAAYTDPSLFEGLKESPDNEYFSYSNPCDFRPNHFQETLQITAGGEAVFLLNPQVIREDGEWEAWFFANWVPGAHRFRSFQELMENEYHRFVNREWKQPVGIVGALPNEYIDAPGSPQRRIKKRRKQAARVLGKPLDEWKLDELLQLLDVDDRLTRREVIAGLGKRRDERAIEPLLALVVDDSDASVAAMHTLKDWVPDRLREPLLKVIRDRHFMGCFAAAHILGEMKELRALPIIVAMVEDTFPNHRMHCDYAGTFLASFGAAGLDALVGLLSNESPVVRERAAKSLCYCKDPRTIDVLRRLLIDPDPQLREHASISLKVLNAPREAK